MKNGWQMKDLGMLCEVLDYKRKPITKRDRVAGEYPYYGATGILDYVDGYLFDERLVLLGEDGAKWDSGEETAYAVEGKCWVNNHAHVLRPHSDQLKDEWLIYYLNHLDLKLYVSGLTVPKLTQGRMREIPVPLPPLAEQKRIVRILDEAFEGISVAKANAEKNLQNARALFESHLQSVFSRRGPGWFEKPLVELCDHDRIITYGVIKLGEEVAGGTPCLRTSNVRWLHIEIDGMKRISNVLSKEYSRTILRGGEVLVNVRGTLGGVAVAEPEMVGWNVSREVAVVPVDSLKIDPKFLVYWIGSGVSQKWLGDVKKGAAYVGINIEDLRLLPVSAPPVKQQKELVKCLELLKGEITRLEITCQNKFDELAALKRSLLNQAFSGQL